MFAIQDDSGSSAQDSVDSQSSNNATYYGILNVSPSAPSDDIKDAFRRKVLQFHPDKLSQRKSACTPQAVHTFNRIQEAYDTLRDRARRNAYDDQLLRLQSKMSQTIIDTGHAIRVPLSEMQCEIVDVVVENHLSELEGEQQPDNEEGIKYEEDKMYIHQCRCGDRIEVLESDFRDTNSGHHSTTFRCPSCSFAIWIDLNS